jgi:hypothetical protein
MRVTLSSSSSLIGEVAPWVAPLARPARGKLRAGVGGAATPPVPTFGRSTLPIKGREESWR